MSDEESKEEIIVCSICDKPWIPHHAADEPHPFIRTRDSVGGFAYIAICSPCMAEVKKDSVPMTCLVCNRLEWLTVNSQKMLGLFDSIGDGKKLGLIHFVTVDVCGVCEKGTPNEEAIASAVHAAC